MTVDAGVTGHPIAHSLSPVIHGAWIAAAALDARYQRYAAESDADFAALLDRGRAGELRGLNVTAPYKEQAFAAADETSPAARLAASANLLVFEKGRIVADSTDGQGLMHALAEQAAELDVRGEAVVILGAGGAARAAAGALAQAGAAVRIVNRSRDRAERLAADVGPSVIVAKGPEAFGDAVLVVNALSVRPDLDLSVLEPGAVVMDMTYRPLETPLLAAARARGLVAVDGLAMLIGQARPSFEALFGVPVPAIDVRGRALADLGETPVIVLGLTGSIGMGKSTTAAMFVDALSSMGGALVWNADAAVHRLYAPGGAAVGPVGAAFPGVVVDGAVDRARLAEALGRDDTAFRRLEAVVHPLVANGRLDELAAARARGVKLAVLDIPLLFEIGGAAAMDAVVVVTADADIQRERVLARPGMTAERFAAILERQIPDADKRLRADFVVDTGQGLEAARAQVRRIVETVLSPDWVSPHRTLSPGAEASH